MKVGTAQYRHANGWANVWGFFAATYASAWLCWLPAILLRGTGPSLLFVVLGAFAPSVMGIAFTYAGEGRPERRDFWSRVYDPRRIGWRWFGIILLLYPVLNAVAPMLILLSGAAPPSLAAARQTLFNPGLMAQIVVANLIISGCSEELGWRGYALDRLQARWTPLVASFALGTVHGLWHLPLFFVPGITQGEMGIASWGALLFLAVAVAGTVSYTWIYNNTQRSILSAILLHFLANLCLDVLAGLQGAPGEAYFLSLALTLIVLDVVLVVTRRPGIVGSAARDAAGRFAQVAPAESAVQG